MWRMGQRLLGCLRGLLGLVFRNVYNALMSTHKINIFAGLMVGLLVFVSLVLPLITQVQTQGSVKTLYIGFDYSDSDHPTSSIVHESLTFRADSVLPFIPVAKVEVQRMEKSLVWYSTGLFSLLETKRSILIRITDGEDREGEKKYWHFPEANRDNTVYAGMSEIMERVQDTLDNLPEGIEDTVTPRLDEQYGRGESIPELRLVELIELMKSALVDGGYSWVVEDLEAGQSHHERKYQGWYIEVAGFSMVVFLISIVVGLVVFIKLQRHPKKIGD